MTWEGVILRLSIARKVDPWSSVARLNPFPSTAGPSGNDIERRLPPLQQEHTLVAEQVPDPPGQGDADGLAAGIERDGLFHLGADLAAQLHEIPDGAEMDV